MAMGVPINHPIVAIIHRETQQLWGHTVLDKPKWERFGHEHRFVHIDMMVPHNPQQEQQRQRLLVSNIELNSAISACEKGRCHSVGGGEPAKGFTMAWLATICYNLSKQYMA